jgi:cell wall-associated NlpC family hydrolase
MLDRDTLDKKVKALSSRDTYTFNCWGFTASVLDLKSKAYWMDESEMEELLEENFHEVSRKDARLGDVVVYRDRYGDLTHTAIFTGNGYVVHKPGNLSLERRSLSDVHRAYGFAYGHVAAYMRLNDSGMIGEFEDSPVQLALF